MWEREQRWICRIHLTVVPIITSGPSPHIAQVYQRRDRLKSTPLLVSVAVRRAGHRSYRDLLLQAVDLNFAHRSISSLHRLSMLLLVCVAQAWLMWRFIHSQLRHWREYWKEQSAKRRVSAVPRLPAKLLKREPGE